MSGSPDSTRRRCSAASEQTTSTSSEATPARSATARHASRVRDHGLTQSAMIDRIDPQVDCADRSRELARDRRLAGAGRPFEDDEYR
jgi:hypothetical protein